MRLRQAKKIVMRFGLRSLVHPSDRERLARQIAARRLPMFRVFIHSRDQRLNAWARSIQRKIDTPAFREHVRKATYDAIVFGTGSLGRSHRGYDSIGSDNFRECICSHGHDHVSTS